VARQRAHARLAAASGAALTRWLPAQERITCKKRFNLLPTQKPAVQL
jgi:hypothetical protein